jgi:hypothetical protein
VIQVILDMLVDTIVQEENCVILVILATLH